jgi:hypothetical protein
MHQSQQSPFTQSLLKRANSKDSNHLTVAKSIDRGNRGFSAIAAQAANNSLTVNSSLQGRRKVQIA